MKAHFIASAVDLVPDIDIYRQIIATLKMCNVSLTSEWLEGAFKRSTTTGTGSENEVSWKNVHRENIEAISKADVVVAEISKKSFWVGFQVASALQLKKPILLLSSHDKVESAIGVSLNEEIIRFVKYTPESLQDKIVEFINDNNVRTKDLRFNFFIDRKILNYLNWMSFQTGATKSETLRSIITKEIERSEFNK